jgi:ubiquitin-conjugating enzyme E2 R
VEWRKDNEAYKKRVGLLVEKANKNVPSHIKIPHPDTDPLERQRQVEKMKLLDKPMDLDYEDYEYDDINDADDDYNEEDEDEDDGVDGDDDIIEEDDE